MSLRVLLVTLAAAGVLAAQDPPGRVGRLNFITGTVSFEPAGGSDWVPADLNRPLTIGDQLFADNDGRAEIHLSGVAFRLGSRTAFEFLNLDDHNVQVRLSEGVVNVRVRRIDPDENIEIDTLNQAFTIQRPGEYRIEANPDNAQTYVTARYGAGEVTTNAGAFAIEGRQQAAVTGQDQVQYGIYEAPPDDDFDHWAEARDQHDDRLRASRYVSPEMVGYEDLDDNGYWQSEPEYGEAWIPNTVPAGWAPYHNGHWAWIEPWGWSWVDDAPWGFAPFHYGRWALFGDRWGWVPGPPAIAPVYCPALVAWFGVGGGGGVQLSLGFGAGFGWFPLGPRDVYIPAYQASPTYVTRINTTNTTVINNVQITNVYNNYVRTGAVPITSYSNRTVPGAAVAVSQNVLTSGRPVERAAVKIAPRQIAAVRNVAPAPRVAPQMPTGQRANVARPPAAVLSKPIVARRQPPPPPPSFKQREALLAKNPGRPIPIQQLHQLARSAPAATPHPAVRVVEQARQVKPTVSNRPAPSIRRGAGVAQQPTAPANQARPAQQAPREQPRVQQQPNRSYEPPSARPQPVPQARPNVPQQAPREQPRVQQQPNRSYQPPAQSRPETQARPNVPERTPQEQPRVQQQPNRSYEPPPARPRSEPQARPNVPQQAPREQPRVQQQPNRSYQPPAQSHPETQARPNVPERTPREQPRAQQPPTPRYEPPAQSRPTTPQARPRTPEQPPREQPHVQPQTQRLPERRVQPPPRQEQARPAARPSAPPAKPRPTDKNDKKKKDEKQP